MVGIAHVLAISLGDPSDWLLGQAVAEGSAGQMVWIAANVMGFSALAMLIWRVFLVSRYRPVPGLSDDELPEITVVVPAYNEGSQVLRTLRSLLASDYPADKLRLVAVDDGSKDDTWAWIRIAKADAPDRIEAIHYPQNRGKRHALNRGFEVSRGEVIVTVDSDSEVEPDTLRNLVSPFADPKVGAVAGNVRILNHRAGAIPRMLDVAFTYGFDFVRASQSEVNTVMCTPGALSAYRRDIVMEVRDAWLGQRFMGLPTAIGEDRAMTNMVLRAGYHVTFQGNAIVYTEVPTQAPQLCRMLLRWARSNIRESWVMTRFVFRRFRETSAVGARLKYGFHVATLAWSTAIWVPLVACMALDPGLGAVALLGGATLGALAPAAVFALLRHRRGVPWAFAYGLYSMMVLSWIKPYAALTMRKNGWLTRELAAPEPARSRSADTAATVRPALDVDA